MAVDKIFTDLENATRWHNSKIFYWHVEKLRGSTQSGLVPVKDKSGVSIIGKGSVKGI